MTTTITVSTEKGGAAKTTTAVNLACALGERGYSVLVVDLDPQGNASRAFSRLHAGPIPSQVTANIHNTTDRAGLAASTAEELQIRGFLIRQIHDGPPLQAISGVAEIRHGVSGALAAKLMNFYLPGVELVDDGRQDDTIDVALGAAFVGFAPQAEVDAALTAPDRPSSADLLRAPGRPLIELIAPDVAPGVDLVPASNVALKMAERELQQAISGPRRLATALKPTDGVYNFLILDTPPSVDGVVVPALVAADYVLSPTPRSEWAVTGAARVLAAVAEIRAAEMGSPEYLGIVWTLTMDRSAQVFVRDQVAQQGLPVFESEIPHRQAAQDAELMGQPALISDPRGDLAEAYRDLAGELLIRMGTAISAPADGGGVGVSWQERKKAKKDKSKKLKATKVKGKKKGAA